MGSVSEIEERLSCACKARSCEFRATRQDCFVHRRETGRSYGILSHTQPSWYCHERIPPTENDRSRTARCRCWRLRGVLRVLLDCWARVLRDHAVARAGRVGAGDFLNARSQPVAISCAIAGLALGLFTEWRYAPFELDNRFVCFITHRHQLTQVTLGLLTLGTFLYWGVIGRRMRSDRWGVAPF